MHPPNYHGNNSFKRTYSKINNLNKCSLPEKRSSLFPLRLPGMENLFQLLISDQIRLKELVTW